MPRVSIRLAVLGVILLPQLTAQAKPATGSGGEVISHPKGLVRIEMPATWAVTSKEFADIGTDPKAYNVINIDASAGLVNYIQVFVTVIFPSHLRPLAQAWHERDGTIATGRTDAVSIHKDPVPHVLFVDKARPREFRVLACRREGTRGLHVTLYCPQEHWPALKAPFFKMVNSATAGYGPWLKPNEKRKMTMENTVDFSANAGVTKSEFKDVRKTFASLIKRLEKRHGPRWRSKAEPLTVHVNAFRSEHRKFDGVGDDPYGVYGDPLHNRILTVPLGPKGSNLRESFARLVTRIFLVHTYGRTAEWMVDGERYVTGMTEKTGKKLPIVTGTFLLTACPTTRTFEQILKPNELASAAQRSHLVSYIALFLTGASEYRKAYKGFLAELRETCDGETATKKHLLSLDQERMRKAAAAITKRMKAPKKRRKR